MSESRPPTSSSSSSSSPSSACPEQERWTMDVKGPRKHGSRGEGEAAPSPPAASGETRAFRTVWLVIACLTFPTLAFVSGVYRPPLAFLARSASQQQPGSADDGDDSVFYDPSAVPKDKYLGGLLAAGFDERSCWSRYQSTAYRKPSPHKPSPHLVGRLREYEERHRRCAPHTAAYDRTLKLLKPGTSLAAEEEAECKYIVWTPMEGLGNRILTIAATFLYALLTNRVLLVDSRDKDLSGLFCEPFPNTTWLLPGDFTIADLNSLDQGHRLSYGELLKNKKIRTDGGGGPPPPPFVYVHLGHDYTVDDMHFFCEPDQVVLRAVPWLAVKSDKYFVPSLFLNQDFEPELARLFPEKETVSHHLCRYLFHPTNRVWGRIARYYKAYLVAATEKLGIQIRVFNHKDAPFEVVSEQVINCTMKERLLPEVDLHGRKSTVADPRKRKAVILTSLYSRYSDRINGMYRKHPPAGGAVVSVHQPSHEERQQTDRAEHDEKAWAEMNLLGFADVLVTTAWSTFGYTGQVLAGVRPWILLRPEKAVIPEPTCVRDISMEPCFHTPPWWVCRKKNYGDNGKVVPFVTHCVDVSGGLKLVDRT